MLSELSQSQNFTHGNMLRRKGLKIFEISIIISSKR